MDAQYAGKHARAFESYHALGYFAPEVAEHLIAAGLRGSRMCYFASRSAPMGAVGAGVVAATFYNFNPDLVAKSIPDAWTFATPQAITEARYAGIDAALRRVLGPDHIASPDLAEAAEIAAIAADAATPEGRSLYAAHAQLPRPSEPHMSLWHSFTLLREFRGDGHLAALLAVGLGGIEALITHSATGAGFTEQTAKTLRGWSDEQWNDAVAGLRDRDILDGSGSLTELGTEIRNAAEDLTDDLALAPWSELGDDGLRRLAELYRPIGGTIMKSGIFPREAFGPKWGRPQSSDRTT
ncbi:SCO6745 family protein [Antrihabitans cavernicola]|uniref:SalK n=1 Tax=Antrihabitans cavernicola TaxID=2495913 RepID=A0A5A7SAV7_9NOCA|nr:hypothetical protein [Spelaeibacter cavernicola]KAA0021703.1 hypothetical protein FOY51_17610 [Spelaeibacter cavernicola]